MTTQSAPHGDLREFLAFAEGLALRAGRVALSFFGRDIARERKGDGSIVTAADREAERMVRAAILERYPDDGIVGEEFGVHLGRSPRRWIVDPIDGTLSFCRGVPLFGTLVGLEIEGRPSVGVAHMPALDETVSAAVGLGCRRNGTPARVSTVSALRDALLLCGDLHACRDHGFEAAAQRLASAAGQRRGWGDCYAHILVATGRADVALDPVMSIWDCVALAPILEEAGGTFTDWHGARTINGGNAISTNGVLFDQVMRLVRGPL